MKRGTEFLVYGILTLLFILLVMQFVYSAHTITLTSNETNGTTWLKGGTNRSFIFTLGLVGQNFTTNLTKINISNANFTLNLVASIINATGWSCTSFNSTLVNCSGNTASSLAVNVTVYALLPSTATEVNHTWAITTQDNASFTNSSGWLTQVDGKAPTITLPVYINGTAVKNSTTLTLNISATDSGSGVTGTHCLVDVNGTNQSLGAISSGFCNGTIGLSGLIDGNTTIKVWTNDTLGNWALNNSYTVQADTTAPSPSASCTPSSVKTGDTVTCSCSSSDDTSGVASSSSSETPSTSRTGTFTYSCTVTDNAGNSATSTDTYTVEQLSGTPIHLNNTNPKKETNVWTKITPGAAAIMKNFDAEIGVNQIQIEVNNEAQNVKISVTKYDGKPAEVSVSKSGKVYQYLQINAQNLGTKLDKATVQFRVEKLWASSNSLDKDEISVYKFDGTAGKWNELQTTFSSEDSTYYYYDVELNSFSYFVVSEKTLVSGEGTGVTGGAPEEGRNLTWLWILIALVIITVVWWMMRKK